MNVLTNLSVSRALNAATPPAPAGPRNGSEFLKDLGSLQASIRNGSEEELNNADSECRKAIDVLINLAAASGPTGENARTALCEVYTDGINEKTRIALLDAAHAMTQRPSLDGSQGELSATILFMGACSPHPPLGNNGPGHIDATVNQLARNLGPEFEKEPHILLAPDRTPTNTELLAVGAKLKNLNWSESVSLASTETAKNGLGRLLSEVARQQKTTAVWVAGADGSCVPVVAQPLLSGGIRFHVLAHNEASESLEGQLSAVLGQDCVTTHRVGQTVLALTHLNANLDSDSGVGTVIRQHVDAWKGMSAEDQQAAKIASQADTFEAVAAALAQGGQQVEMVSTHVEPGIVVELPSNVPVSQPSAVPSAPQATRGQMMALVSAAGFHKDSAGQAANVWGSMSTTMNIHVAATGAKGPHGEKAGFMERRRLMKDVEQRMGDMTESNSGLMTAVIKAERVPAKLATSALWAHLEKVRVTDAASRQEPLLKGMGQGVSVLSAQLIVRMKMLSDEIAKAAAYVTSNDSKSSRNTRFQNCLLEAQSYIQSSGTKLEMALSELQLVMNSTDKAVTSTMKADATTMWRALEALRVEFQNPAGTAQQLLGFAETALASADNLQLAADAIVL